MYIELSFSSGIKYIEKEIRPKRKYKGKNLISFPDTYCVVDLETTGLDPFFDNIIEISSIKVNKGSIVDTFSSLINIGDLKLDSFITDLSGITDEMLSNAPDLDIVLSDFLKFVDDSYILGHNINFDINFIYDNCLQIFSKPFSNNFIDTLRLSRKLLPNLQHHKLSDIAKNYDIDYSKTHRALSDCTITNTCYSFLKEEAIKQYNSLENFINSYRYSSKISNTKTDKVEFDTNHPFYNKTCAFTGKLDKMPRKEAAQIVADLGGICADSVTQKTDYLILGNTAYSKNIKDGKTSKFKKAQNLKAKGYGIEIITENVFYDLLTQDEN